MNDAVSAVLIALIGIVGGVFGQKALDKFFERDRRKDERGYADNEKIRADNEQARVWLRNQLDSTEVELQRMREREHELITRLTALSVEVARLSERSAAQAYQIESLQKTVAHLEQENARLRIAMGKQK